MIESKAMFDVIDIKRDAHQDAIGTIIVNAIKDKNLKFAIDTLSQLREYLMRECSVYPIDLYAENG